jgi:hypothetical protein
VLVCMGMRVRKCWVCCGGVGLGRGKESVAYDRAMTASCPMCTEQEFNNNDLESTFLILNMLILLTGMVRSSECLHPAM